VWHRVVATQPPPSAAVVAGTLVVAAVLVLWRRSWRVTRHVVTIVHEGAHGVAALLTGRRLSGIRLHSDTSGVTVSVGRPRGPGMVLTAGAGYVGPALLGLGAAALLAAGHAVALLWGVLVLLALLLVQIRNWFGLWSILVTAALVFGVSWWAPQQWQSAAAYVGTWFLLLAAPWTVLELHMSRRRRQVQESDVDTLARLTWLPAMLWLVLLFAGTLAALVTGSVWIVGHRPG
jgi:hypothetical protein